MTTQIASALSQGFTAQQVINFLMRQFPNQSKKIKKAISAGYSAEQVLGFLSGGNKELAKAEMGTEQARTRQKDIQGREDVTKGALKGLGTAALAAGTVIGAPIAGQALQRASPMAMQALQRAAPQLLGPNAVTQIPGAKQTQLPQGLQPIQGAGITSSQSPVAPNLSQQPAPIQPEVKTIDIKESLKNYPGFESKINDLLKTKNPPEAIAAYFKKFNAGQTAKLEKEIGKPIEEIVLEYIASNPTEALQEPNVKPIDIEEQPQETPKIEKGSTVASPQGIGEIKEIRNGKAIVEVDGKKHQVNEDEIIQSPIPEKDIADLYDDLIQGIEKTTGKQVSRNVDWSGYDPNTNELAYKPHGSDKLYVYEDISPEDVEVLTNYLTQRKSTGSNFIGAWEAGSESPIGAAMYQLIKKLQSERGGKGKEYKNKYETIYSALEPAILASKKKHQLNKKKKS